MEKPRRQSGCKLVPSSCSLETREQCHWQQREPGLLAELRRVDPDIIAMQEAWRVDDERQGRWFATELGFHVFEAGDLEWERVHSGQAVLSRWQIRVDDSLDLSGYDGAPGATPCSPASRGRP